MKIKIITVFAFSILFASCGDLLNYKKEIRGNYYLVEGDSNKDISIYYKTKDGDFIKKIPGSVLQYGINDSFIVAKSQDYNRRQFYYIINMTKDFDLAIEENFRVGPISEFEYLEKWQSRLKIKFIKIQ
jgi:hypothetical protein